MAQVMIVDDEVGIRELLSEILVDEGHEVSVAENAFAARRLRELQSFDLVLLDIWMPDTDGITLLKEWVSTGRLTMPVVMMSGHATIETAVEATRIGALDFLEKPIALQRLLNTVRRALHPPESHATSGVPIAPLSVASGAGDSKGSLTSEKQPVIPPEPHLEFEQTYRDARNAFERSYFEHLLAREQGSMSRVAEKSGLERTHLYRKLKALGLSVRRREE